MSAAKKEALDLIAPIINEIDIDQSFHGKYTNVYQTHGGDYVYVLFKHYNISVHALETDSAECVELETKMTMHRAMNAPSIVTDREVYRWARRHKFIRYIPRKLNINYDKKGQDRDQ